MNDKVWGSAIQLFTDDFLILYHLVKKTKNQTNNFGEHTFYQKRYSSNFNFVLLMFSKTHAKSILHKYHGSWYSVCSLTQCLMRFNRGCVLLFSFPISGQPRWVEQRWEQQPGQPRGAQAAPQEARGVGLRARGGGPGRAPARAAPPPAAQATLQQRPQQVHRPGAGGRHQHGLRTLLRWVQGKDNAPSPHLL